MEFQSFGKIPRLSRECIITEKIDGTNAQICIKEASEAGRIPLDVAAPSALGCFTKEAQDYYVWAGSRTRWITPDKDNYGFARWAYENVEELLKLGPGSHFGEWWGSGIQRRYGLTEKRFSLFNTHKWNKDNIPSCCSVVPELFRGEFHSANISKALDVLKEQGSLAALGFMDPEGIIIYHVVSGHIYKKTLKDDEKPKAQI